ncbi:MAG: hypothetical protein M3P11_05675 [Actinomycetota bacterium]|nr:hypothetical protein [Actinomycetota bacterium]
MSTIIRFNGGGERVVSDESFVMNETGVHYKDESADGKERLHVIPWNVIHEVVQEREAVVMLHEAPEAAPDLTVV